MAKQLLDKDLVDMELTEAVLEAIKRAESRGVPGHTIFGTLQGAATAVAEEHGASLTDVVQVVELCWQAVVKNSTTTTTTTH